MSYSIDGRFAETYHGFNVVGEREDPTRGDYLLWFFRVRRGNILMFQYNTKISGSYANELGGDDAADKRLFATGKRHIHGKIDLRKYHEGEVITFQITNQPPEPSHLERQDIRLQILRVLERLRESNSLIYKQDNFDVNGFCEVLGIRYSEYLFNATYLQDEGHVAEASAQQHGLDNGYIYITTKGIDYLEIQQQNAQEAKLSTEANMIRDQILRVLYENEQAGNDPLLDSTIIAERLSLADKTIRFHLEVLRRDGYVSILGTFTDFSTRLTINGKQRVMEGYQHSPSVNVVGGTSVTFNNSPVGIVNTGHNASFDQISVNISQLTNEGQSEVAEALKHLTDFVAQNQEIASEQREELLDYLADLSEQATLEPEKRRKPSLLRTTVNAIAVGLGMGGSAADIWSMWGPAIKGYFGIS